VIPIDFDKPRNLKFDLAAIKDLEANCNGQPLGSIVNQLAQLGITALTTALWAGLKHEDRTLTPNLVTKMLERYISEKKSMRVLARALNDAIDESGIFRNEDDELLLGNAPTPVQ
jgi:hypothetical protein